MQFKDTKFGSIDGGETKLVGHLPYINLFNGNGIIVYRFDDALDPLFAAELEIDHTAGHPGLYGLVFLFQHQKIALRIGIACAECEKVKYKQWFHIGKVKVSGQCITKESLKIREFAIV